MPNRISISSEINNHSFGSIFIASNLYSERFKDKFSEEAYYKSLSRMCINGELVRVGKGIYCYPQKSRFGFVLPTEKEYIDFFTKDNSGVVVGYSFYNSIKLTTQVSKSIEIYSSVPNEKIRTIKSNITIKKYDIEYTDKVCSTIRILEILNNYYKIQDINNKVFLEYCKEFSKIYDSKTVEQVLSVINYPKRTIAFLKSVLDFYKVKNDLNKHLSSLSNYKAPSMEDIYAASQQ